MTNIPRIVVASPSSGSGKTTVSIGLMGALARRGLRVQPFKIGPDFIDPSLHTALTGRLSRNLDVWLTSSHTVQATIQKATADADIAVIEGVMGLYDGISTTTLQASTAHIASLIKAPILLTVDIHGMARSAAAVVAGFSNFDPQVKIDAVILNRVGNERHFKLTSEAIHRSTKTEVVGGLPIDKDMKIPERHLGLIPADELSNLPDLFKRLTDFIEEHVRVHKVLEIARRAPSLSMSEEVIEAEATEDQMLNIGVARDEAFSFYYPENLELLEQSGLKPVFFSPLHDEKLPENISGLYLAGGFPELYAYALSSNRSVRSAVKNLIENEMPVYAECGGLMYLTRSITDLERREHRMVGLLKADTVMMPKLQALNYTKGRVVLDTPICRRGVQIRGHEFHYSRMAHVARDASFAYSLVRGKGIRDGKDGWLEHQVLASYMHLHFALNARFPRTLAEACRRYNRR